MRTSLVAIGNSRGIRIPKALIEQTGLQNEIEIDVRGSELVIRSARKPREGWEEAFHAMAVRGDDQSLDAAVPTTWDETEWTW
ncbi:MAG: AbrB/MazE/SpoVT family DNA-binding domain-containing protein [Bryobacteraceae bacterium]